MSRGCAHRFRPTSALRRTWGTVRFHPPLALGLVTTAMSLFGLVVDDCLLFRA
jgi:hypothetical protein